MTDDHKRHIAVVGAGVVGLSCGLWLTRKGFSVTLIDPDLPGAGTSSGSACTIAEYGCIPVNSPDLFKRLPSLLFAKDSPLRVDPAYVLRNPRWMLGFLQNCRPRQVQHIIRATSVLLQNTWDGLDPLLTMADTRDLLEDRGFLQVFRTAEEFNHSWPDNQTRQEYGVGFEAIDGRAIRELEPNLQMSFDRGLLFEGINQVLDPLTLCQRYAECLERNGGRIVRNRVSAVKEDSDGMTLMLEQGDSLKADKVVIAAGAFSKFIEGAGSVLQRLDTERGYHLLYPEHQSLLSRPVSWHAAGFYMTPMNLGLRVVGMVEIAGYHSRKNQSILAQLARVAGEMLDLPDEPASTWLGYRPTFPDSLPAIGYAPGSRRIIHATGHHHLGLTQSGITGKLVSELAAGEETSIDLEPFDPGRFG